MTGCTTTRHLLGHASLATVGCEAPRTMYPRDSGAPLMRMGSAETASSKAVEGLGEAAWVM